MAHPDYLERILTARVYDVAAETSLDYAAKLSARLGNELLLKREDEQSVFSFKVRGAYNKLARLSPDLLAQGVIAASAGNHAQGVALGARMLGARAVIVMPVITPELKVSSVRSLGGEAVLYGESFDEAYAHALELQQAQNLTFVHPFDDPDVIAGQGTIAMEILRQHQRPIHAIFAPIGGGGLISGIAAYVKRLRPEIRMIGVEPVESDAMSQSIAAGRRVKLPHVGLFADGVAVKQVGKETFRLCRQLVDEIVLCDTDEMCAAIKDVFEDTRSILEPSGALSVAGAKAYAEREGISGETLIAIASGANMNFDRLRFVADRAEVGEQREALLALTIPEERGSFRRLCAIVGPHQVTEFTYRIADSEQAHVFVGLGVRNRAESREMAEQFRSHGFETLDLTEDELAKQHLRHLVGGRSKNAEGEVLYRFEFPERPGALMRFLSNMSPSWNISLFHYRNEGADYGHVVVGMQIPPNEKAQFRRFLRDLGFAYVDESGNAGYRLFLDGGMSEA